MSVNKYKRVYSNVNGCKRLIQKLIISENKNQEMECFDKKDLDRGACRIDRGNTLMRMNQTDLCISALYDSLGILTTSILVIWAVIDPLY